MYSIETYNKLYETAMLLKEYYDIDKVKSWAVFVWDKDDDKNSDCGLFDIFEDKITFYTDDHNIIQGAKPIIKQIQKILKQIKEESECETQKE